MKIKNIIYYCAKFAGLFFLARLRHRSGARILCYHGFSIDDEHHFRPRLFVTADLFERRLEQIAHLGFKVVSLDTLVAEMEAGTLAPNSLVITVDDGLQGVENIAAPLLKKYGFDWTLYLTTYYCEKQTQILNLAVQYFCWKTRKKFSEVSRQMATFGCASSVTSELNSETVVNELVYYGQSLPSDEARQEFLRELAQILEVDQVACEQKRMFNLINAESVRKLHDQHVHIELHTHRHRPVSELSEKKLAMEIAENKVSIEKMCGAKAMHFCYPSGTFEEHQKNWLAKLEVTSATTCVPGLNYPGQSLFSLNRFLDSQLIPDIVFEAELSGFADIVRHIRPRIGR